MLTKVVGGSVAAQAALATLGYFGFSQGMSPEQKSRLFRFLLGASLIRIFEFMFAAFAFIFVLSGMSVETGGTIVSFVDNWTTGVADFFYNREDRSNRELLMIDLIKGALAFLPTVILAMTGGLAFGKPRSAS
ncbi:MAG: hypothetical protein ACX939_01515 [Hyphococcus sp.]